MSGPVRPKLRFRILQRDNFRCRYCGRGPDIVELEIDHIVPRSKGGAGTEDNLQTICTTCNAGKSNAVVRRLEDRVEVEDPVSWCPWFRHQCIGEACVYTAAERESDIDRPCLIAQFMIATVKR